MEIYEVMGLSTKVYPPVIKTEGISYDIKYGQKPDILYPQASFYKGQLHHSDSGVIDNSGKEFADIVLEKINKIDWFIQTKEQSKIPLDEIISRFCTSEHCRYILLNKIIDMNIIDHGLDYYLNHVRYNMGEDLLCSIKQHEIDQLEEELCQVISQLLKEYIESKE